MYIYINKENNLSQSLKTTNVINNDIFFISKEKHENTRKVEINAGKKKTKIRRSRMYLSKGKKLVFEKKHGRFTSFITLVRMSVKILRTVYTWKLR